MVEYRSSIPTDADFHIKEFYLLQGKVDGLNKAMELQFESLHVSINVILDRMNTHRKDMKDHVSSFVPRNEFTLRCEELMNGLRALNLERAETNAKCESRRVSNTASVLTIISIGIAFLALCFSVFLKWLVFI